MGWLGNILDNPLVKYNPAALPATLANQLIAKPMEAKNDQRAAFDPYSGMPQYPGYIGMEPNQLQTGPAGQKFTQEAMRNGPSQAAQLAMKNQGSMALRDQDTLRKQAAGTAADAKNSIAMHGGLNSGQAGLINMEAGNHALEVGQNARSNANTNIGNIQVGDEAARMGQLQGAEGLNAAQQGRFSMENTKQNAFNLGAYGKNIDAWAANKQAQATANSGKK